LAARWKTHIIHVFEAFEKALFPEKIKQGEHELDEPTESLLAGPDYSYSYKIICWKDPDNFSECEFDSDSDSEIEDSKIEESEIEESEIEDSKILVQKKFSFVLFTSIVLPGKANCLRIPCTITLKAYETKYPDFKFGVSICSDVGEIKKSGDVEAKLEPVKSKGREMAQSFFTDMPTMSNFVLACDELLNKRPYDRSKKGVPDGWKWGNMPAWRSRSQKLAQVEAGAGSQHPQNDDTGDWDTLVGEKRHAPSWWLDPKDQPGFDPEDLSNSVSMQRLLI